MKKVISVKEILIILISVVLITMTTTAFAINPVLGDDTPNQIQKNEYENAQNVQEDKNTTGNNTNSNNTNSNNTSGNNKNTVQKYNTNNKNTNLPQTGIEDYNVGILLVISIASAIFAYKKIIDYRNI